MLALWAGKIVSLLLKRLKRRGTSLPGFVGLKLSPRLIEKLSRHAQICIIVTGTNGKTTTTALIKSILIQGGKRWIVNDEGSNMLQGIATTLINAASWTGKLPTDSLLFEVDEANIPMLAQQLPVTHAVVTNVFRDQLDRYGEVDSTLRKLQDGLRDETLTLILNGDDPLVHFIGLHTCGRTIYYGMGVHERTMKSHSQVRDGAFCLVCGNELSYCYYHYGQMGQYNCEQCGFSNPMPSIVATPSLRSMDVTYQHETYHWNTPLRGLYNQYNALAAVAVALVIGTAQNEIEAGLSACLPSLGRMQVIQATPERVLNLIKNPTGCNSVLATILEDAAPKRICLCINDFDADGRDVSWLWDADFDQYAPLLQATAWICGGTRAADMALRLKYAGVPVSSITVCESLQETHDCAMRDALEPVYFLCTYTALYPLFQTIQRGVDDAQTSTRASVS